MKDIKNEFYKNHNKIEIPIVYCTDETGGSIPAFYDGTNWRRVSDRAIVS